MTAAVGAVLIDFDGTACPADVSEALLEPFAPPGWQALDEAVDRGEIGLRECVRRQGEMLTASPDEMLEFVLDRFQLDPTLPPFAEWADAEGITVQTASDGFCFFVRPMLDVAGLSRLEVLANELVEEAGRITLRHPDGHPVCVGCGTCKMLAATRLRERHGAVAFVGEGRSDRYGALYSDVVFAKSRLVEICRRDGMQFLPWETFDDVKEGLESTSGPVGALAPTTCPGWRER